MATLLRLVGVIVTVTSASPDPVLLWHGMGDTCCNPGFQKVARIIAEEIPDVYVRSVRIGNSTSDDFLHSYFGSIEEQIDSVCKELNEDPKFAGGYSAIGFSQGSQFLRGLAEKCPWPRMKNLISFGGQHQGVFGLPRCTLTVAACKLIRKWLKHAAYSPSVQKRLVQAQYWHDPFDEETFRRNSLFLADINNEQNINEEYRRNLQSLKKLVLVMFLNDSMWFGFYYAGQSTDVAPMEETKLYTEDRIGLKAMKDQGKLYLEQLPGDHLFLTEIELRSIIQKYLK